MPRKSKMWKIRHPHCRKMEYLENNDKRGKGDLNTVGLGISWETRKDVENEKHTLRTWNVARNTEKTAIWETHTVGPLIWLETVKTRKKRNNTVGTGFWRENWKMRNAHYRTWNMARNQKNVKNETKTLLDMEYREKHWKTWKMKNAQCRTWNVEKKKKKLK